MRMFHQIMLKDTGGNQPVLQVGMRAIGDRYGIETTFGQTSTDQSSATGVRLLHAHSRQWHSEHVYFLECQKNPFLGVVTAELHKVPQVALQE